MSAVQSALMQEPRYLERRRMEYLSDMKYFSDTLFKIHSIMPCHKRFFFNGTFEQHIPEEWQKLIDKVMEQKNEFVKSHYPEFYDQQ